MTVLLTGAAGQVGRYLREGLPPLGWDLRLLDRVPIAGEPDAVTADICDQAALASAMNGVDAVVHLAGEASPSATFEAVLHANVEGAYAVFETARHAGVGRVVLASSNHANGFSPRSSGSRPAGGDRPDSYYGVSKIFGEALGRLYADRYGMAVACLRIGSCFDRPTDPRMLSTWLSPGDAVRLVHACLSHADLTYAVVSGVSANTRGWWDLAPARALGYEPQDNAEHYAVEVLAGGGDLGGPDTPQGGDAAWSVAE